MIAFICGVIVIILMIMALASTDWLMAEGWRQGLFVHCIEEDVVPPLPFNLQDPPGCYPSRDAAYIKATAALCIITLITDAIATLLTGLGLRTQDHNMKYKFYRIAVLVMLVACKLKLNYYPNNNNNYAALQTCEVGRESSTSSCSQSNNKFLIYSLSKESLR